MPVGSRLSPGERHGRAFNNPTYDNHDSHPLHRILLRPGPRPLAGEDPPTAKVLFDFADAAAMGDSAVEDDVIIGGRSKSARVRNPEGHIVFSGDVSLENEGGFAFLLSLSL